MNRLLFAASALLCLCPTFGKAQILEDISSDAPFEVQRDCPRTEENKGFCKKGDIDYVAIVKTFGVPDEFPTVEESRKVEDIGVGRMAYATYIGPDGKKDNLWFQDNGFCGFYLRTNRFAAFKYLFPDGIRVGDSIERVTSKYPCIDDITREQLGRTKKYKAAWYWRLGEEPYRANFVLENGSDYLFYFYVTDNIITAITYDCTEI